MLCFAAAKYSKRTKAMVSLARVRFPDVNYRWMPKKVSDVVGPSTLDDLIDALSVSHSVNMAWRFRSQVSELAEPAVKKSSK